MLKGSSLPCHRRPCATLVDAYGVAAAADDDDEDARALETQTERRAARRAEHEKAMKQRAREAAASLRHGGGNVSKTAESAKFARDYALEIAKRVCTPRLHRKSMIVGRVHAHTGFFNFNQFPTKHSSASSSKCFEGSRMHCAFILLGGIASQP